MNQDSIEFDVFILRDMEFNKLCFETIVIGMILVIGNLYLKINLVLTFAMLRGMQFSSHALGNVDVFLEFKPAVE
jgi:hypothetical protein